jgi:hypothetical protein
MAREKPVAFTRPAAERIARVCRRVESSGGTGGGGYYPYRADEGEPIRIGKVFQAWNKGTLADVTVSETGNPGIEGPATPPVVIPDCVNRFADVEAGKMVAIAAAGNGRWYLISAEC